MGAGSHPLGIAVLLAIAIIVVGHVSALWLSNKGTAVGLW
jgi:hypothetical protein